MIRLIFKTSHYLNNNDHDIVFETVNPDFYYYLRGLWIFNFINSKSYCYLIFMTLEGLQPIDFTLTAYFFSQKGAEFPLFRPSDELNHPLLFSYWSETARSLFKHAI